MAAAAPVADPHFHVLVVDDCPTNRKFAERLLKNSSYRGITLNCSIKCPTKNYFLVFCFVIHGHCFWTRAVTAADSVSRDLEFLWLFDRQGSSTALTSPVIFSLYALFGTAAAFVNGWVKLSFIKDHLTDIIHLNIKVDEIS
ncbi:hypothetical protein KSP40_PGU000032 [Platanthera guangdongensis]|uniref:Response regulatory domain-containing protein n=1 Tax=Platanthera guangdongensis TaxID=2320717 RepID=A0ABR2LTR3_9ASPA